jgi:hypothetical protein
VSFVRYEERPESGPSADAWDFFTNTYGTVKQMTFYSSCGGQSYWMTTIDGKIQTVTPLELKATFPKLGKIKFESTK